jgi:hypothetical protein
LDLTVLSAAHDLETVVRQASSQARDNVRVTDTIRFLFAVGPSFFDSAREDEGV